MKVINTESPLDALIQGLNLIQLDGIRTTSRNGDTLSYPTPVATVYQTPLNKVLLSKTRDCNPFFHLMEALWILDGREDVKFLCEFNKQMKLYSDDGIVFNAPYGWRMRNGVYGSSMDQITEVIDILSNSPDSRQAVIQIWDNWDLNKVTKDKACNMSVVFRIRQGKLHMTVYNRSNDIIWGAYGANVVQFSMLLEYVAAHLNIEVGTYTQVSNDYHVYLGGKGGEKFQELIDNQDQLWDDNRSWINDPKNNITLKNYDIADFDCDLAQFFFIYDRGNLEQLAASRSPFLSNYFNKLVLPMLRVWVTWKQGNKVAAVDYCSTIESRDWQQACFDWMENRLPKN